MILRNDSMPIYFFYNLHSCIPYSENHSSYVILTCISNYESENQICCMLMLHIEIDVLADNQCKDSENKVQTLFV